METQRDGRASAIVPVKARASVKPAAAPPLQTFVQHLLAMPKDDGEFFHPDFEPRDIDWLGELRE